MHDVTMLPKTINHSRQNGCRNEKVAKFFVAARNTRLGERLRLRPRTISLVLVAGSQIHIDVVLSGNVSTMGDLLVNELPQ